MLDFFTHTHTQGMAPNTEATQRGRGDWADWYQMMEAPWNLEGALGDHTRVHPAQYQRSRLLVLVV